MYACIDLGSNSFHLLIAEKKQGRLQIIERCSDKVQLGEGVNAAGNISPAAFERGLESLRHFQSLMTVHGVESYWALGTNTFRIADNAQSFIDAAERIGIHISVISGVQEAMLVYAGVISGLPPSGKQRLVVDIGGGSTEVIIGRRSRRLITHSLPVGCVAWRDAFFPPTIECSQLSDQLEQASAASRQAFTRVAPGVVRYGWAEAYASSGTAKMLAAVCEGAGFPAGEVSLEALLTLREGWIEAIARGEPLAGLKDKRRDLLLPGYAVMVGLLSAFGCARIRFSPWALREGMLEFLCQNRRAVKALKRDPLPAIRSSVSV